MRESPLAVGIAGTVAMIYSTTHSYCNACSDGAPWPRSLARQAVMDGYSAHNIYLGELAQQLQHICERTFMQSKFISKQLNKSSLVLLSLALALQVR
jgi:pantothenate kinase